MNYYMLWTKVTKGYRLAIFPLILQKEMSPIAGLQKTNFLISILPPETTPEPEKWKSKERKEWKSEAKAKSEHNITPFIRRYYIIFHLKSFGAKPYFLLFIC